MYFVTNKGDLNKWSKSLENILDLSMREDTIFYREHYNNLQELDKNWIRWLNQENVYYRPDFLKEGNIIKLFKEEEYKFLFYEKDYLCVTELKTNKKIGLSSDYVEIVKK